MLCVGRGEGGGEAAVEAEHDGHRHGAQLVACGLNVLHIQGDRLLAQNGLAGLGGGEQVGDVQRRGRADNDGVDTLVGEHGINVGRVAGAVDLGQLLRGIAERIRDEGEGRVFMMSSRTGMSIRSSIL